MLVILAFEEYILQIPIVLKHEVKNDKHLKKGIGKFCGHSENGMIINSCTGVSDAINT